MGKLYVINTAKKIHCLNHITGPVTTPVEIEPGDVLDLVKSGFEVYEVNPYNKKERVKVTPYNYNSIMFKTTLSDMVKRRQLNRELQQMAGEDKKEIKKEATIATPEKKGEKKEEPKKKEEVVKKEEPNKEEKVEKKDEEVKPSKISHTDFQKD